jgi:uracil-DNA glycosylase
MIEAIHPSWQETIKKALKSMDSSYLEFLEQNQDYFPDKSNLFNAFKTLPKNRVKYILFGQDPYPRRESATGYAFIDGKVREIFSQNGLSKEVNRATSLRNFIKMALVAEGLLECEETSQEAIKSLPKENLINSIDELRLNFEKNGVLLLNTALIFTSKSESKNHIKNWRGFIKTLLEELKGQNITLILFGNFAKDLKKRFDLSKFETIELEHPYNNSFICNERAIELFGKMELLRPKKG